MVEREKTFKIVYRMQPDRELTEEMVGSALQHGIGCFSIDVRNVVEVKSGKEDKKEG